MDNPFTKDVQVMALRAARNYLGDRLVRVATPHKLLDPRHGPLIAVRLNILTRKSLGGLETDLSARAMASTGEVLGRALCRGRGGRLRRRRCHGYNSLEGTFLGGCIFSGRTAGRAAAKAVA